MRLALFCLAVAATMPAAANLYKCVGKDGKVAYQAEPCAAAQQESRLKTSVPEPAERGPNGVALVDVRQAAQRVSSRLGRPTVVMLYSTGCSLSQAAFPEFVKLANQYRARGVDFVVLSTDEEENFGEVPAFLAQRGAPFEPVAIKRWEAGDLGRAFAPLGIRIGSTWTRPLIAMRDRDGKVVGKMEGQTDLAPLRTALAAAAR